MAWFKVKGIRGIGVLLLTAEDAVHTKVLCEKYFGPDSNRIYNIEEVYVAITPIRRILEDLRNRGYHVR